ncbi:multicopper oxidase [Ostertagia ostertagi]
MPWILGKYYIFLDKILPIDQHLYVFFQDGVYVFDLVVERKLTMTSRDTDPWKHGTPIDYAPSSASWSRREPDQLKDCFQNYTLDLQASSNDAAYLSDVVVLDGKHKRVLMINGKTPGDPIVVPYLSEVLLRVRNNVLMDSISLHVHGIDKHDLWYMDGVSFIQQCPILSTNYFEYRFIADNKGTHWYHGHFQTDRGEGLLGGFVVVDENDRSVPTNVEGKREVPNREYYVMLQDWATETGEESYMRLKEKTMKWMYGFDDFEKCWQPTRTVDGGWQCWWSSSDLGIADKRQRLARQGRYSNETVGFAIGKVSNQQRFSDELVLFRITNGGVAQELMLHVEGHQMLIVAADGNEIVPQPIDRLIVFPGERYDVLIRGLKNPTKKSYMMVSGDGASTTSSIGLESQQTTVRIIEYQGEQYLCKTRTSWGFLLQPTATFAQSPECTPTKRCTVLNCPFESYPSNFNFTCMCYDELRHPKPSEIDKEILKDTPFTEGYEEHFINMHYDSHVDGYKYEFPLGMPLLQSGRHGSDFQAISTFQDCKKVNCSRNANKYDDNCNCFYHLKHKLNNIVQITLYNMGTGGGFTTGYAHPFHIHGTHFHVMKVGWPSYNSSGMISTLNPDIECNGPTDICDGAVWRNKSWMNGAVEGMNTENPSLRDTITLPVGGYIVLRFRATNPGWWFAHCHLELHAMSGTAYAFQVGEHEDIAPPPTNFPHDCGAFRMPALVPRKISDNNSRLLVCSLSV